jgi:hypothetical protein
VKQCAEGREQRFGRQQRIKPRQVFRDNLRRKIGGKPFAGVAGGWGG